MPALASLTDIMRLVFPTQKTSTPNPLKAQQWDLRKMLPSTKVQSLCLTISPPPSTPPALPVPQASRCLVPISEGQMEL